MVRVLRSTLALIVAAACVGAAPTTQRTPATQRALVDTWLAESGHPEAAVREAAGEKLFGLTPDELPLLRDAVMAAAPLRAAQRDAVEATVLHLLTRASLQKLPTAGESMLGINLMERPEFRWLAPTEETPGPVPVFGVLPGFAAARYLQAGDVILALVIDRQPHWVRTRNELIGVVSLLRTGTPVTLWLRRSGRPLSVTFDLDAKPGAGLGNAVLEQRWVQETLDATLTEATAATEAMLARDFPAATEE